MYNYFMAKWGRRCWATVAVYAGLLSQFPDSHIVRKFGNQHTELVAEQMTLLSKELTRTDNPELIMPLLHQIDQELKSKGLNPGTTADMTVATVLTVFLQDHISNI